MNKTWKPIAAGILNLVDGSLQLLASILIMASMGSAILSHGIYGDASGYALLLLLIFAPLVVTGTIAIIGGIFARRRSDFSWALTGSLMGLAPCIILLPFHDDIFLIILGLSNFMILEAALFITFAAVPFILTILSRREFETFKTGSKYAPKLAGFLTMFIGTVQVVGAMAQLPFFISNWNLARASEYVVNMLFILPALLAIMGGIYALRRRRWRLALTGALAAFVPFIFMLAIRVFTSSHYFFPYSDYLDFLIPYFSILAISAVVLAFQSKRQFEQR